MPDIAAILETTYKNSFMQVWKIYYPEENLSYIRTVEM